MEGIRATPSQVACLADLSAALHAMGRMTCGKSPGLKDIQRGVLPLFADVPIGRVGELHELADAVAFLACPLAGYITGINLHVDGGFSSLP